MADINTVTDLKKLGRKIRTVRARCMDEPELEEHSTLWYLFHSPKAKESQANDYNDEQYEKLQETIKVSPEMGRLIVSVVTDHLRAKEKAESRLGFRGKAIRVGIDAAAVIFAPSPATIAALTISAVEAASALKADDKILKELKYIDQNVGDVLGSYALSKNSRGSFILERGLWRCYSYDEYCGGHPRGIERIVWRTMVDYVGIDDSLLPARDRHLLEKYASRGHGGIEF